MNEAPTMYGIVFLPLASLHHDVSVHCSTQVGVHTRFVYWLVF